MVNLQKLSENTEKYCGITGGVFTNTFFDLLFQLLFATLYNIEKYPPRVQQFKKAVLSKRNNPEEYYKALIEFACL